jgi:cytochrome c553
VTGLRFKRCDAGLAARRGIGRIALVVAALVAPPVGAAVAGPALDVILEGCVPCHGADGIARDSEVPHLAGQNELYLINQMRAFRSGNRVHPEMAYMMHDVDDGTIAALAAYFAELPPRP